MRPVRIFTLGLIATSLTLVLATSCKKSNNSTNGSTLSATISGTVFSPAQTAMFYSTDSALFEFAGTTLKAGDTSALIVAISAAPPFAVNKAMTDANSVLIDYTHNNKDYWNGYTPGHFSLTVTSLDSVNHKVAGNFTGTLYSDWGSNDSVVITNGNFNTTYIVQP